MKDDHRFPRDHRIVADVLDDLVRAALRKRFFELIVAFGKQEKVTLQEIGEAGSLSALRDQIIEDQLKRRYIKDLLFLLDGLGVKCVDETTGARFVQLVEMVLRRNLHVHNRGIVDERYLDRDQHGNPRYNLYNLKAGQLAPIDVRALVDGRPVECLVTAALLLAHFGAQDMSEESMRQAYREHAPQIQDIVRKHIENGWIDEDGRIVLTTRFTRLRTTFSSRLGNWPRGLESVTAAHRTLTQIIGPNAEEVVVEWDGYEEPRGGASITLLVTDPSISFSAKASLDRIEWEKQGALPVILADAWGSVLRARSRKLILQSG